MTSLDELERLAQEASRWHGRCPLDPTTVLDLIAKARLGEAWARAEAALPEGAVRMRLELELTDDPRQRYEASASMPGSRFRGEWLAAVYRPTPEAALDALVSELER